MKIAGWTLAVLLGSCALALGQSHPKEQDNVLFFNADRPQQGRSCIVPRAWVNSGGQCPPPVSNPNYSVRGKRIILHGSNEIYLEEDFFIQGRNIQLQVVNRKFLSDYRVTLDTVTQLKTGPDVRNLDESANLTLGPATLASLPASKAGTEGLTGRTATQILLQLVDETTSGQPKIDLDSDVLVIERERAKLDALIADFAEKYNLMAGTPVAQAADDDCNAVEGAPTVIPLQVCLDDELEADSGITTEGEFADAVERVKKLMKAVSTLRAKVASPDLANQLLALAGAISQYENDLNVLNGNVRASGDAVQLEKMVTDDFRKQLRRQEIKVLLLDKLKGADSKPTMDDAEMNSLLDRYQESVIALSGHKTAVANIEDLTRTVDSLRLKSPTDPGTLTFLGKNASNFRLSLAKFRSQMDVVLPDAIKDLNKSNGKLLLGINDLYDHSQIAEPLHRDISLGGLTQNLSVGYTVWQIEGFRRYNVGPPVEPEPGVSISVAADAMVVPVARGAKANSAAAPSGSSGASPNPSGTASGTGGAGTPSSGEQSVPPSKRARSVAHGTLQVHQLYQGNVVAAVAFSTLKDQSITAQAQPLSCIGTASSPDPTCASPLVLSSHKWTPIVGLDYYFQRRDTYPRTDLPWLCREHPRQCFGIMGAASATKANNYFLGGFCEPVLGVQFGAGANFGTEAVLQSPYAPGVPVDIKGSFPTYDKRTTGLFISAGLDLSIFRKVFGKFTGIGTAASGTSGQ
jgi:hypothetical protein